MVSEGKSEDRFSSAGIAGTYFCGFLWLNIASALMALFFPLLALALQQRIFVWWFAEGMGSDGTGLFPAAVPM